LGNEVLGEGGENVTLQFVGRAKRHNVWNDSAKKKFADPPKEKVGGQSRK